MHAALQSLRARRARGEDKGFTLIELLVVVVIIGILIAIAIPLYLNYQKGAHNKAAESDLRNAIVIMEQCYSDSGSYPTATITATGTGASPTLSVAACGSATDGNERDVKISAGTVLTITPNGTGGGYTILSKAMTGDQQYSYNSATGGSPVAAKLVTT